MKLLSLVVLGFAFLLGIGTVLLRTQQSPLPLNDEIPLSEAAALADLQKMESDEIRMQQAAPAPALTKPKLSEQEFRDLRAQVMDALLSKGQMIEKREQAKSQLLPQAIILAGESLAKISEAVQEEPALADLAIEFYQDCASKNNLADSVRALCFRGYRNLSTANGRQVKNRSIPRGIRDLADQIGN